MFANQKMERLADLKKISQNFCNKENKMFFIFSPILTKKLPQSRCALGVGTSWGTLTSWISWSLKYNKS